MPIVRRSDCIPLPIVVCPFVAVVKLESRVARCVHCVENVAVRSHPYLLKICAHVFTPHTFKANKTVLCHTVCCAFNLKTYAT